MYRKKLIFLLNINTIIISALMTNFAHKADKQNTVDSIENKQISSSKNEFFNNFNLKNFEADNTNAMIEHSWRRKNASAILSNDPNSKKEFVNLKAIANSPLQDRSRIYLSELQRIQNVQDHLHRISNNSVESYNQFAQQVLAINSPDYYKNPADVIKDFENVELRDGVNVQMELEAAFDKAGEDAQHIVNMYNYFNKLYGKENVKRWLFTLIIRDKFANTSERTLGITSMFPQLGAQYVSLKTKSFDKKVIQQNFNMGWFTSNSSASTFIHEYGHVLENALEYLPGEVNRGYLPSQKFLNEKNGKVSPYLSPWAEKEINQDINKSKYKIFNDSPVIIQASEEFVKFVGKKLGFASEEIQLTLAKDSHRLYSFEDSNQATITSYIIAQLFVDGNYGKTNLREQFAEMFTYWLWKPTSQTDSSKFSIRWTVINEFFLDYLPKKYHEIASNIS